jgi:hypothetical protein
VRHIHIPETFTFLGLDGDGREYIQCTRTGDVLVQSGPEQWSHFASAEEWRARTAAILYPELIHIQRTLKSVGLHEEKEDQLRLLREALALVDGLKSNLSHRIEQIEADRAN